MGLKCIIWYIIKNIEGLKKAQELSKTINLNNSLNTKIGSIIKER